MTIQVVGSGCPTCKKLYEMTQEIVKSLELNQEVEYISGNQGIQKIIDLGVMGSPVLVINHKPVMVGFTPDSQKIIDLIKANS